MSNDSPIFEGCIPALMTPCDPTGAINYDALVETAKDLIAQGMRGVVYCGSMGDWPLLTDQQRMEGTQKVTIFHIISCFKNPIQRMHCMLSVMFK